MGHLRKVIPRVIEMVMPLATKVLIFIDADYWTNTVLYTLVYSCLIEKGSQYTSDSKNLTLPSGNTPDFKILNYCLSPQFNMCENPLIQPKRDCNVRQAQSTNVESSFPNLISREQVTRVHLLFSGTYAQPTVAEFVITTKKTTTTYQVQFCAKIKYFTTKILIQATNF